MGVIDLEYGEDAALENLLRSIDRPGDFCAHGRQFAPMPRLEVDGVGFNLCLRPGDRSTPRKAPDFSEQIDMIAKRLVAWRNDELAAEKLVLLAAMKIVGPKEARQFLLALSDAHFAQRTKEILALLRRVDKERSEFAGRAWDDMLREGIRSVLGAVSAAPDIRKKARSVRPPAQKHDEVAAWPPRTATGATAPAPRLLKQLTDQAVCDLFTLAWRWDLTSEAETAAGRGGGRLGAEMNREHRTMPQLEHIEAIEKRLWEAADTLRANSNYASNEYFLPVMGLVFLRHAYSRYLAVKDEIEAALPTRGGKKPAITKQDFSRKSAIFLRPEAQFDHLLALPDGEDRARAIITAMESIETDYDGLRGVLPKSEYQELDNDVLGQLLRSLNPDELKRVSGDVFGRICEYFLTRFADQKAHDGGEFFTPVSSGVS